MSLEATAGDAMPKKTCYQCRLRKVRCGREPRGCSNCKRLKFACSLVERTSVSNALPVDGACAPPSRRRGWRACLECRSQKSRCSGDDPQCVNCRRRGRSCVYPVPRRSLRNMGPESLRATDEPTEGLPETPVSIRGRAGGGSSMVPATRNVGRTGIGAENHFLVHPPPLHDELVALARSFFCCLHPMTTYSFLHESSVTQRVLDDTLDPTLALALCSITAMNLRLGQYYPSKTDNWIREAEHHIWDGIENPTTFRLQALILVVQYLLGTGRFQRAFMMASIAGRSAMALRLNYERPDLTPLAQEIRRRLMWTVLMMDIRFSVGLPEFEMCPYEGIYLKLPTSDDEFNSYSQWSPPSQAIRRGEEGGLLAFVVRLTTMRRDVTRLTRQLSLSEQSVPRLVDLVEDIRRSLLRVRSETPGSRLYHLGNLEKSGGSRWRTRYWTAHLSWHQCNCDLYRPFLRGYKEAAREMVLRTMKPDYMSNAASLCLEHATSIIQIIADIDQRSSDSDLMEFDNAICAYHATRIVLFMSSSKADSRLVTKDDAITQASMCLGFLRRFLSTVPMAASMIAKLEKVLAKRIRDQEDQNHSGTSSDSEENEPGLTPRLSRVARASQRLGVHSLVRQARFVDDSHSCASDTGTGSPQTSGALLDDRATSLTATSTSSAAGGTSGSVGVIRSPWMRGGDTTAPQDIRDLPASGPSLDFLGQDFHHNNIDLELNSWVAEWQQGWTRGIFEYNGEYY